MQSDSSDENEWNSAEFLQNQILKVDKELKEANKNQFEKSMIEESEEEAGDSQNFSERKMGKKRFK